MLNLELGRSLGSATESRLLLLSHRTSHHGRGPERKKHEYDRDQQREDFRGRARPGRHKVGQWLEKRGHDPVQHVHNEDVLLGANHRRPFR